MFSIRRLMYLILVTCAALAAHVFFYHAERYWIIWATLSLSLIPFNITFVNRIKVALLSGIIFALAVFATSIFLLPIWLIILLLTFITMGSVFIAQIFPQYYLSALTINVFSIVAYLTAVPLLENTMRLIFIIMSGFFVLLAQIIFWPQYFQFEIRSSARAMLQQLAKLNSEFFSCYLESDYKDNLYLYERRIHKQKNKCMMMLQQLRKLKLSDAILKIDQFEIIFDLMLDHAQLRFRVSDYTTFGLCRNELLSLAAEFENIFNEFHAGLRGKKYHIDIQGLNAKIKRFEENYQNVLQVAAREPLVFLLFIASLRELSLQIGFVYERMLTRK